MPSEMNDNAFRRLVGSADEEPEEAAARRERLAKDEPQVRDVLSELPDMLESRRRHYLDLYRLADTHTEDEKAAAEASYTLLSEEQGRQLYTAEKAYDKRGFPIGDAQDTSKNLVSFAATNPPEVLRKHVWRLQRGLDEPLFGKAATAEGSKLNYVRVYQATVTVSLCNRCAEELERETEESGAERVSDSRKRLGRFYERGGPMAGYFLFKYGEMYVEREEATFFSTFPLREPEECARCGTDDVTSWRERFGDKGESDA